MKKLVLILLCVFLLSTSAYAQKNTIKLLAVTDNNKQGTVVDLDVEIIPGSGRVLVETRPLSNIDTQISLRIAKTIACKTADVYCQDKDFIYTIKSTSPVIAGPSAGAAIALVTRATLENNKLDENFVITGTINSGGVIGVVGGVNEKLQAASKAGLKTVLIPYGEANASELRNMSRDLNITILEVGDLEQAYALFTHHEEPAYTVEVDKTYKQIMENLNKDICQRNGILLKEVLSKNSSSASNLQERAKNLSLASEKLAQEEKYYSSASKCFGANVLLREALLVIENNTESFTINIAKVSKIVDQIEQESNASQINTLGDLEANMIVRERVDDARKNIEEAQKKNSTRDLAYAIERTYSALAWKQFIGFPSKRIDQTKLEESCIEKIAEAQEVYNYVALYVSDILEDSKEGITLAKEDLSKKDYASCLFRASKAQAEIDTAFSSLYVPDGSVESLLANKISAAKKAVAKQTAKDSFPILGYSYYEYAQTLSESEKYSALLYAEYGIELSNLDIYFPQQKPFEIELNKRALITLVLGLVIGAAVVLIRRQYKRNKITLKRRK